MDSGAAPHHSHRLVGLLPSTFSPPLGERHRWSRWTTSHIDSHMMGDHEDEILELPSPPHEVGEEDPTPTSDPPPNIPTHTRYDPSFTGRWYWFPGDATHHEPGSTSYDMSGIPTHDLAQHAESEFEPNTMPGGIPSHFLVERFGNTSHVAPSIPVVEVTSYVRPRPRASTPIRIPEPR